MKIRILTESKAERIETARIIEPETTVYKRTTRRERLERKLEKRDEWAKLANARAQNHINAADRLMGDWPMGQPFHSQADCNRRDRAYNHIGKSIEEIHLAEYHQEKADGLKSQLATTIFSDDENAIDKIESKIKTIRETADFMKLVNKTARKNKWGKEEAAKFILANRPKKVADEGYFEPNYLNRFFEGTFPTWKLQNLNQEIRRLEKRITSIKARAERLAESDAAGGILIKTNARGVSTITFSEYPGKDIIRDLKSAHFFWQNGSWHGCGTVPESVKNYRNN